MKKNVFANDIVYLSLCFNSLMIMCSLRVHCYATYSNKFCSIILNVIRSYEMLYISNFPLSKLPAIKSNTFEQDAKEDKIPYNCHWNELTLTSSLLWLRMTAKNTKESQLLQQNTTLFLNFLLDNYVYMYSKSELQIVIWQGENGI